MSVCIHVAVCTYVGTICVCGCSCVNECAMLCLCISTCISVYVFYYTQDVITVTSSSTQLIGYNDEILDIALVGNDNGHVAVATNSEQARVFNRHSMNCQLLSGHSGI